MKHCIISDAVMILLFREVCFILSISFSQQHKSSTIHSSLFVQGPVVLSRDHHDVSGTDRYRGHVGS